MFHLQIMELGSERLDDFHTLCSYTQFHVDGFPCLIRRSEICVNKVVWTKTWHGDLWKPTGADLNRASDVPNEFNCINLESLMPLLQSHPIVTLRARFVPISSISPNSISNKLELLATRYVMYSVPCSSALYLPIIWESQGLWSKGFYRTPTLNKSSMSAR